MTPLEQILQRFRKEYDSGNGAGVMAPTSVIESLITEAWNGGAKEMRGQLEVYELKDHDNVYKQGFAAAIGKVREEIKLWRPFFYRSNVTEEDAAEILQSLTLIEESTV